MKEVIIDGKKIYYNTEKVDKKETGVVIRNEYEFDDTIEISPVKEDNSLDDTLVDFKLDGDNHE